MGFAKLDEQILDSTLWADHNETRVFLTALVMARPWVFDEPMLQMEVRSMETTGFVVPPGWYGFVQSAGIGLIRRAQVEEEKGYLALEALGKPDIESRSGAFDGRRLVRVDGGYIVLNYMKWRDRDDTAAERQQRYRERQKEKPDATVHKRASRRDVTPVTRNATVTSRIAEAEAEAEAETTKAAQAPTGSAVGRGPRHGHPPPTPPEGGAPSDKKTSLDATAPPPLPEQVRVALWGYDFADGSDFLDPFVDTDGTSYANVFEWAQPVLCLKVEGDLLKYRSVTRDEFVAQVQRRKANKPAPEPDPKPVHLFDMGGSDRSDGHSAPTGREVDGNTTRDR